GAEVVPTEWTITAAAADFTNAGKFEVSVAGVEDPIEVDLSATTSGSSIANALNTNEAFDDAGLEASYSNGVLTITDPQGRELSDLSLVDAGAEGKDSSGAVELLQSALLEVDIVKFMVDGEEVVLRGIEGGTGTVVAASIETALNAITVDGETPYDNMKVTFADDKLTIADPDRREISDIQLLEQLDDESEIKFTVSTADEADIAQLTLTIDGVTKTVDVDKTGDDVDVGNLQTLLRGSDGFGIDTLSVDRAVENDTVTLTIKDSEGRPFDAASSKFLDDGAEAVASVTKIGPLSDGVVASEVGQFSIKIGDDVLIENLGVSESSMEDLAATLQSTLRAADDDAVDISVEVDGNQLKVTDEAGRGISDVYVGGAIDAEEASVAEISGLTDLLAGAIDSFSIKIGSVTYEFEQGAEDFAEGKINFANDVNNLTQLAAKLEEALWDVESVGGRTDITVAVKGDTNDSQTLVITDASGRALADVSLSNSDENFNVPATATLKGITDNAVNLDIGYVSVEYTDKDGDDKTFELVTRADADQETTTDNQEEAAASITFETDPSDLEDGDKLSVTLPASAT
ncbi:hypothetical protein LRB11_16760, partial [Ectothiorhodospira haloalkaliphila]|uniref:hypothetical protein n=1 Tax=Ectothiorhodospira haloalkaliphila TaxID=421628 RepID=UPI001EE8B91E